MTGSSREDNKTVFEGPCFVAIDFDGTVTDVDIIDAVLQRFAPADWLEVEQLWEMNIIGSRDCLERQMAMLREPLARLLGYIDAFTIDHTFLDFVRFLRDRQVPFAIVSDGFRVFIERMLANAGLSGIVVLANELREEQGRLVTAFPYADPLCESANCKCTAVRGRSRGRSLIVVGDGRSDFCLAQTASYAFTKKKLTGYCQASKIPHTPFVRFSELKPFFKQRQPASHILAAMPRKDESSWKDLKPNS